MQFPSCTSFAKTMANPQQSEVSPAPALTLYRNGRIAKQRGDLASAEACYTAAVEQCPDYVDAWISLGILHRQAGRFTQAAECHRQALIYSPEHPLALLNLGSALVDLGEFAQAGALFRRVLQINPESAEAHNNLAKVLWRDLDMQAAGHWMEALRIRPDYFEAAQSLGECLYQAARFDDAVQAFEIASRLQPQDMTTQLLLGRAQLAARQYSVARVHFERLLHLVPDLPRAKAGLAAALAGMGQYTKPLALYRAALAAAPEDPWIAVQYFGLLLRSGDFTEGWRYFDYRSHVDGLSEALERGYAQPKWTGEPLAGKRLLMISEQGLGDEIMFASAFAEAIAEADHCVIECDVRLEALFRRSFPQATFVGIHKGGNRPWTHELAECLGSVPRCDLWTTTGDFVASRRRSRNLFPRHSGYLHADPARVAFWAQRLRESGLALNVGLSWRGGTPISNQTGRTMSLDLLAPLLREPGVRFTCLQYGACAEDIAAFEASHGIRIQHFPEALADYDETAALVAALDLVVSVCTSIIHLGGALGRQVWVMAPLVAEWRYGHEGRAMIWYPSVTIHRQVREGEWGPVIAQVRKDLRRFL
jgi:tetratricopeptide (TPR) repeat protein